jgi:ribosomal protein L37E
MGILLNFINGLKKSFDGKDHLREISNCEKCGNKSYLEKLCLYCSTEQFYIKKERE